VADNPGEPFDDRRAGLDHVNFAVETQADVLAIAPRAESRVGEPVSVKEVASAVLLTLRDPDNIAVEICCSKAESG
jgi:hypothetical protein